MSEVTDSLKAYTDLIIAFAAVVAAVVGLHRKLVRPFMVKVEAMAAVVEAQLTANGGGNLVDKVSRIPVIETLVRDNHKVAEQHWTDLENRVEIVEKRLP